MKDSFHAKIKVLERKLQIKNVTIRNGMFLATKPVLTLAFLLKSTLS